MEPELEVPRKKKIRGKEVKTAAHESAECAAPSTSVPVHETNEDDEGSVRKEREKKKGKRNRKTCGVRGERVRRESEVVVHECSDVVGDDEIQMSESAVPEECNSDVAGRKKKRKRKQDQMLKESKSTNDNVDVTDPVVEESVCPPPKKKKSKKSKNRNLEIENVDNSISTEPEAVEEVPTPTERLEDAPLKKKKKKKKSKKRHSNGCAEGMDAEADTIGDGGAEAETVVDGIETENGDHPNPNENAPRKKKKKKNSKKRHVDGCQEGMVAEVEAETETNNIADEMDMKGKNADSEFPVGVEEAVQKKKRKKKSRKLEESGADSFGEDVGGSTVAASESLPMDAEATLPIPGSSNDADESPVKKRKKKKKDRGDPEAEEVAVPQEEDSNDVAPEADAASARTSFSLLNLDILHLLASQISDSRAIFDVVDAVPEFQAALCRMFSVQARRSDTVLKIDEFMGFNNPFIRLFHDDDGDDTDELTVVEKAWKKRFKQLLRILDRFIEYDVEYDRIVGVSATNLNVRFPYLGAMRIPKEERMEKLYESLFKVCPSTIFHCIGAPPLVWIESKEPLNCAQFTCVDLGDWSPPDNVYASRLSEIIKELINLTEFTWHEVEDGLIPLLPCPHKMKKLWITLKGRLGAGRNLCADFLGTFQSLCSVFVGDASFVHATARFSREDTCDRYITFFDTPQYSIQRVNRFGIVGFQPLPIRPQFAATDVDMLLYAWHQNLEDLWLWQCPRQLFEYIITCPLPLKKLTLGRLNQEFSQLCLIGSVTNALDQLSLLNTEFTGLVPVIEIVVLHLETPLLLDSVSLLTSLLEKLYEKLPTTEKLDITLHSRHDSHSGRRDTNPRIRDKYEQFTSCHLKHLSIHWDGYMRFRDFDLYLPSSLVSLTLSVNMPEDGNMDDKDKCLRSLLGVIYRFSDVNKFPDLRELHLQVWGIRCVESILNTVANHMPHLYHLSVVAMSLKEEERDSERLRDLVAHVVKECPKLKTLGLAPDFIRVLTKGTDFEVHLESNWRLGLSLLHNAIGMPDWCELVVGELPKVREGEEFVVRPHYPPPEEDNEEDEETNRQARSGEESNEEEDDEIEQEDYDTPSESENDSFVCGDEEIEGDSDQYGSELSDADAALEEETERRESRAMRKHLKRLAMPSSSESEPEPSDEGEEMDEEDEEEEERRRKKKKCGFFDDEADEDDDDESGGGSGSDSEGNDEDEDEDPLNYREMTFSGVDEEERWRTARLEREEMNRRPNVKVKTKKRIILSDSEDE